MGSNRDRDGAPRSTGLHPDACAFNDLALIRIDPADAGSNGVGDLAKELAYMQANSSLTAVQLVPGTQPFKPNLAGAILGL